MAQSHNKYYRSVQYVQVNAGHFKQRFSTCLAACYNIPCKIPTLFYQ